jgi:prolyl oligopeptidase
MLRLVLAWMPVMSALAQFKPPATPARPVTEVIHGVAVTDPYRWLEDQQSPETRAWIEAQIKHTRSLIDPLPFKPLFRARLTELMKVEAVSIPVPAGGRLFYTKRRANEVRHSIYMRPAAGGEETLLADPAKVTKSEMGSVSLSAVSIDGRLIAYGVREGGADEEAVRFLDVDRRRDLPDVLPPSNYFSNIAITPDKTGVIYADLPGGQGPRVFRRKLGDASAQAEQIFGQAFGAGYSIDFWLDDEARTLVLHVGRGAAESDIDVWTLDLAQQAAKPVPVVRGLGARCRARVAGNDMFLLTDWNAPLGRIFHADLRRPQRHFWRLIVPESGRRIEDFTIAGGRLVVNWTRDVASQVEVISRTGKLEREIALPAPGTVYGITGRWSSPELFLLYTAHTVPMTVFRTSVSGGPLAAWFKPSVPFDPSLCVTESVTCRSKDGARVPMRIVRRKDTPLDGARPTLLYSYGGFNISLLPAFSALAAAWVERGGVYAVANLRGGGEFGETWHRAGMLDKKQNVFDDFIAAAEWLIANKYANAGKLAIMGASNGGLLVGAAMTQRPDLYRAVVCSVPLLDMLRYHKFLLGPLWVPEYGSADDPKQFERLLRYSPYHNVKPGTKYPAVIFVTGDSDTRVAPLHARKMAALMQASTSSGLPVLLLYDTSAGHSQGLPVTKQIEDQSDILAFLASQLGLAAPAR